MYLRVGQSRLRIPEETKKFSLLQKQSRPALGPIQPSIRWVPVFIPWGYSEQGMKLAIHLQLVSELKNECSCTLYVLKASIETN